MLGKWAIKERIYGHSFNAIMFRRTTVSAEDAIERSKEIYGPLGGRFNEQKLRWRMPNGGRVSFAYLENVKDANEYQGRNVTDGWVEEAGHYPDSTPIDRLFGVLRSAHGIPVQLILTANPGGAGQHWLRHRYGLAPFPSRPKVLKRDLPTGETHLVAVIPSRLRDNLILMARDPGYVGRLHLVGSTQLVKAWLQGDWTAIEGAFFDCWSESKHVIAPFAIPRHWLRFRSGDWGSASPFSIGWWAVVQDDFPLCGMGSAAVPSAPFADMASESLGDWKDRKHQDGADQENRRFGNNVSPDWNTSTCVLPRGALVRYREDYGASVPGKGLKLTAEQVAARIVEREKGDPKLAYGVLDPSTFKEDGGPSIAERINAILLKAGLPPFREADNARVARAQGSDRGGPMGGWDQLRARMIGEGGVPMIYCFSTCPASIRTIPVLQHDPHRAEDLDTNSEDHAADDWRYAAMSRPWLKEKPEKKTPHDGYRMPEEEIPQDSFKTL